MGLRAGTEPEDRLAGPSRARDRRGGSDGHRRVRRRAAARARASRAPAVPAPRGRGPRRPGPARRRWIVDLALEGHGRVAAHLRPTRPRRGGCTRDGRRGR